MKNNNYKVNDLEKLRHSCSHLLAAAVLKLWPGTKLGIGPAIEEGFYYDFEFKKPISEEDLPKIEKEMGKILKTWSGFDRIEKSIKEAKKFEKGQPYKLDLIDEFSKTSDKVSFYKSGQFVDLCKGGHVENIKAIGPFKLLSVAGAYWRGSEKNPMLTRIYGACFKTKKEMDSYLSKREKAKELDHKKIGRELNLFTFLPQAPGMPFWYPNGLVIVNELKSFIRKLNNKYNYQEISTPALAKKEVWKTSGHWQLFRQNMFTFDIEGQTYALKPMNCPETLLLYNTKQFSYRDLPLRWSDLDVLHRYEESGTLNGLFRVREMSQDDAHIICTHQQISSVVNELIDMAREVFKVFDLSPKFYLATKPDKAIGEVKVWKETETSLTNVLNEQKVDYKIKPKEGTFYGPKIDLHVEDSLGRDWQLSTIQLDFQMPKRFSSIYINEKGKPQNPVMIHRALLGSLERFIGILLEHFAGALPTWLSPIQAEVIPITDRNITYAQEVLKTLKLENIRAEVDDRSETLQSKIRDAQLQKIPYMIIVGDKEQVQKKVSVRSREKGDEGVFETSKFIISFKEEINEING